MADMDFDIDDEDIQTSGDGSGGQRSASRIFGLSRGVFIVMVVGILFVLGGTFFAWRFFNPAADFNSPTPTVAVPVVSDSSVTSSDQSLRSSRSKNRKIKYIRLYVVPAEEAARVLNVLSLADIAFDTEQTGQNYTILVDSDFVDDAKNILAVRGLPSGGAKGYELLDDAQTLGVTEFDKRIRFVRALSGELERAIMQFDLVERAKVQVVLPEQRLFTVSQPPVTASVLVRIRPGKRLNDEAVYGIIQLVSNAVEGLQPENVSIVDTEGNVLSDGVLERVSAKRTGGVTGSASRWDLDREEPIYPDVNLKEEQKPAEENPVGQPIIPNIQEMQGWYDVKDNFEKTLQQKASDQLLGILPKGSYRVLVTSELGPLSNGEIVDVVRLAASVVVDNNREDIYLTDELQRQVFDTVSAAIGYQEGRDSLQVNRADFGLSGRPDLGKTAAQGSAFIQKIAGYWKVGAGLVLLGVLASVVWWLRSRRKRTDTETQSELFEEMSDNDVEVEYDSNLRTVKRLALTHPQQLAQIMEAWLSDDMGQQEDMSNA